MISHFLVAVAGSNLIGLDVTATDRKKCRAAGTSGPIAFYTATLTINVCDQTINPLQNLGFRVLPKTVAKRPLGGRDGGESIATLLPIVARRVSNICALYFMV